MARKKKTAASPKKNQSKQMKLPFEDGGFVFDGEKVLNNNQISPQTETMVLNAINESIMGLGGPFNQGTQLNQTDTLWINNRWYLLSNFRQLISESYVEHGILQTIVNLPVDDAFRGGIELHTKELDQGEIEDLTTWMEECGDLNVIKQTCKWNRLFGGAGTVLNVDADPAEPLDLKKITRFEMYAADMWELFWNKQNIDDYAIAIDTVANMNHIEYFDFYGHKLHKSKVLKQKGIEAPSLIRPRLRGWGVSVMEVLVNSINQYLKSNNLIFEVLDEFKVDYYKIKNLANSLLQPEGQAKLRQRIAFANQQKDYQNAVVMDSEEEFIQKELSFQGIAETMHGIRMQIASDMRMPMSKVFGISSQGFGSGEDDIENYNAMIESSVREQTKFEVLKVVKIRCQLKFGFVPDDLKLTFKPLRMLSAEQQENVKTQKYNRIHMARTAGEITSLEYRNAVNKDLLLEIKLETDDTALLQIESEKQIKKEGAEATASPEASSGAQEVTTRAPEAKV